MNSAWPWAFMLSIICGCATSKYSLKMDQCQSEGGWKQFDAQQIERAWQQQPLEVNEDDVPGSLVGTPDFSLKQKVTSIGWWSTVKEVELQTIIGQQRLDCAQLASLQASFNYTWTDILVSLLPFIDRATLELTGTLKKDWSLQASTQTQKQTLMTSRTTR